MASLNINQIKNLNKPFFGYLNPSEFSFLDWEDKKLEEVNLWIQIYKKNEAYKKNPSKENLEIARQIQKEFKTKVFGLGYGKAHDYYLEQQKKHKKVDYSVPSWQSKAKNRIKKVYFDVETSCLDECCYKKGDDGKIICWIAIEDNGKAHHGHSQGTFIKLIKKISKSQRSNVYFWGHNSLKFDNRFFLHKLLHEGGKEIDNWGAEWKNIKFFDTWLVYKTKLENLPMSEEERFLKREGSKLFENPEYHEKVKSSLFLGNLAKYCKNDAQILKRLVDTLATYKKGTFSSQAMYIFRKECIDHWEFKKYFPNFGEDQFDEKRKFVQNCFKGGLSDLWNEQNLPAGHTTWKADVVSSYSYIMTNKPMPVGQGQWIDSRYNNLKIERNKIYDGSIEEGKEEGLLGFYQLKIKKWKMKDEYIKGNVPTLFFVKGSRGQNIGYHSLKEGSEYWITGNELKFLMKYHETDFEIENGIVFRTVPGKKIFGKFIDKLFPMKKQLDEEEKKLFLEGKKDLSMEKKVLRTYAKNILNGLFGKFGQGMERENRNFVSFGRLKKNENGFWFIRHPVKKKWQIYEPLTYSINNKRKDYWGYVKGEKQKVKGFNYNPVSAAITSYMRVELNKAIVLNKDIVLAWDTDGAIFKDIPRGLDFGKDLGQWKLVKHNEEEPYIATNAKFMVGPGFKKMAGVPQNSTFVIDKEKFTVNYKCWRRYLRGVRIFESEKIFKIADYAKRKLSRDGRWLTLESSKYGKII